MQEAGFKIAVLDVETDLIRVGEIPKTKFWGIAVKGEEYRRFETTAELCRFLKTCQRLRIFCHFDFDFLKALGDGAPLTVTVVRNGRILGGKLFHHEMRNSYALFQYPLKAILESCGFEKPALDDLEARNRADTVDALAAFEMLDAIFYRSYGISPLWDRYYTAAGVSFAAAQREAGPLPVDLRDRIYYRGGRVEAFRLGDCGPADKYDVQSSYPAAFVDLPPLDALWVADVTIKDTFIPPCFKLTETREKLLFPVGKFRTVLFKSGFEKYIEPWGDCRIDRIVDRYPVNLAWVKRVSKLIERAFEERKKAKARGDAALAFILKILINSLYGRIGLKQEREKVWHETDPAAVELDRPPNADVVSRWTLPGSSSIWFSTEFAKDTKANYPVAAAITANARDRLYDGLKRVNGAYYCDTDSVFCIDGTPGKIGKNLGDWEYEGRKRLTVNGAKDYRWGEDRHIKGGAACLKCKRIMRGADHEVCFECLGSNTPGHGGEIQTRMTLKSLLKNGVVTGGKRENVNPYDKRQVLLGSGLTQAWEEV